ncbi:MAG: hypothetical protein M1826_000900, partial [Phylliscum demangeonii]
PVAAPDLHRRTYAASGLDPPSSTPFAPAGRTSRGHEAEAAAAARRDVASAAWTGLPRFVGERVVTGEGVCYFYDDGSYCRKVIDGEAVNAHWGVTKAGRPRKRLAVACLTCREKKIKCEPDFPKCVQCEKFGRVCKFKNASPHAPGDAPPMPERPSTPATTFAPVRSAPSEPPTPSRGGPGRGRRPSTAFGSAATDASSGSMSSEAGGESERRDPAPSGEHRAKRRRQGSGVLAPSVMPAVAAAAAAAATAGGRSIVGERAMADRLDASPARFQWPTDPYELDPALVRHLVTLFLGHVNAGGGYLLPRAAFLAWVQTCRRKTEDDVMLLYTILMAGAHFSTLGRRRSLLKEFTRIARHAIDVRREHYTVQLVQSRLVYALQHYAWNRELDGWEVSAAAIRTAVTLGLHRDDMTGGRGREPETGAERPYGLEAETYAECRRRTFWAAYLMDRWSRFGSMHACTIQDDDVFLRLPCDDASYEAGPDGGATPSPLFSGGDPSVPGSSARVSPMASLVHLARIWGAVVVQNRRGSRPAPASLDSLGSLASLARHRVTSGDGDSDGDGDGDIDDPSLSMTLHCLQQSIFLAAHRHQPRWPDVEPAARREPLVVDSILRSRQHAIDLLRHTHRLLARALAAGARPSPSPDETSTTTTTAGAAGMVPSGLSAAAAPWIEQGVLAAADTLLRIVWRTTTTTTAVAPPPAAEAQDMLDLVRATALPVLDELKAHWHPAKRGRNVLVDRLERLERRREQARGGGGGADEGDGDGDGYDGGGGGVGGGGMAMVDVIRDAPLPWLLRALSAAAGGGMGDAVGDPG